MKKENILTQFGDFVLLKEIKNDMESVKNDLRKKVLESAEAKGYVVFPETGINGKVDNLSIYYKVWAIQKDKLVTE